VLRGVLTAVAVLVIWGLSSATQATAAPSCWQQLLHDWADGRLDGAYSVSCYRQALAHLPEDLRVYSSAPDDIEAALRARVRQVGARSLAISSDRARSHTGGWSPAIRLVAIIAGLVLALGALLAARV
jgi:hypothetical protein